MVVKIMFCVVRMCRRPRRRIEYEYRPMARARENKSGRKKFARFFQFGKALFMVFLSKSYGGYLFVLSVNSFHELVYFSEELIFPSNKNFFLPIEPFVNSFEFLADKWELLRMVPKWLLHSWNIGFNSVQPFFQWWCFVWAHEEIIALLINVVSTGLFFQSDGGGDLRAF